MKRLIKFAKSNVVIAYIIYVIKYKLFATVKWYIAKIKIVRKTGISKSEREQIRKYKNSKRGQKCIIVGNGPSVRFEDLNRIMLSDIDSFGTNRIFEIFSRTKWRPTYYCIQDPGFLLGLTNTAEPDAFLREISDVDALFFTTWLKGKFSHEPDNLNYVFCPLSRLFKTDLMPFSDECDTYISDMGSVTHFAIQLATYMGYKTIYLYGMDNSYTKYMDSAGKFHIDDKIKSHTEGIRNKEEETSKNEVPTSEFQAYKQGGFSDVRKFEIGYGMCKEYCEEHSIEIFNLTRGGHLETFDRMDFDLAFLGDV